MPDGSPMPETFEALFQPVLGAAFGAALQLTRNRADAEDLVQDAALLAFRGFHTFQPGSNFRAWFFKVLYNCFLSKYRPKKGDSLAVTLDDATEALLQPRSAEIELAARAFDPARATIDRLQIEQVQAALQMLPEEFRAVCTMYFIDDFSYQEIADMLGIPVGTVRSRLHRGRKLLQKQLWALARDQGLLPSRGGTPAEQV